MFSRFFNDAENAGSEIDPTAPAAIAFSACFRDIIFFRTLVSRETIYQILRLNASLTIGLNYQSMVFSDFFYIRWRDINIHAHWVKY